MGYDWKTNGARTTMKPTCRDRCLRYLKKHDGEWVASGHMQRLAQQNSTFTGATVARELRRLAEDGEVEVKQIKKHAHYRWTQEQSTQSREARRKAGLAFFETL